MLQVLSSTRNCTPFSPAQWHARTPSHHWTLYRYPSPVWSRNRPCMSDGEDGLEPFSISSRVRECRISCLTWCRKVPLFLINPLGAIVKKKTRSKIAPEAIHHTHLPPQRVTVKELVGSSWSFHVLTLWFCLACKKETTVQSSSSIFQGCLFIFPD